MIKEDENINQEQSSWPYTALAFKGGSVRGRAYLNALRELERRGFDFSKIERVIGTSAGSIMALGLALGYTVDELEELDSQLNYEEILDDKYQTRDTLLSIKDSLDSKSGFFGKSTKATSATATHPTSATKMTVSLENAFGLYEGQYFLDWAEKAVQRAGLEKSKDKKAIKDLTFGQLHEWVLSNKQHNTRFKDLYVIAYDIAHGVSCVLSWETDKNMPIADAIRASMSIPFLFKPYHCHKKIKPGFDPVVDTARLFIDGGTTGVMDNFPLRKFDYQHYVEGTVEQVVANKLPRQPMYNPKTLGFCLVEPENEKRIVEDEPLPERPVNAFMPYFIEVLKAFYGKQDRTAYLQEDRSRTIFVSTAGVKVLDFNLTKEKKDKLDEAGPAGVQRFIEEFHPEKMQKQEIEEETELYSLRPHNYLDF